MEVITTKERLKNLKQFLTGLFVKKTDVSEKKEVNTKSLKVMGIAFIFIFISVVFLMPNEQPIEFTTKTNINAEIKKSDGTGAQANSTERENASSLLWGSPRRQAGVGNSQVNQNTSMLLGSKNGNAKTQLRAGSRLPLRIMDKFIVSQDSVPILAELITDSITDAGLKLPAGTRFYGEANFQKGAERATIQFKQISLPNGQIKPASGIGVGKDGQPGLPGRVYSDGMKNTAGQVLTTFVGGLASGSVETDVFGRSKGGIGNGLLTAVANTATDRAQVYGEKLKAEREWIEVEANSECDVILSESMNLQLGNDQ